MAANSIGEAGKMRVYHPCPLGSPGNLISMKLWDCQVADLVPRQAQSPALSRQVSSLAHKHKFGSYGGVADAGFSTQASGILALPRGKPCANKLLSHTCSLQAQVPTLPGYRQLNGGAGGLTQGGKGAHEQAWHNLHSSGVWRVTES
jgi:hypothetical protein